MRYAMKSDFQIGYLILLTIIGMFFLTPFLPKEEIVIENLPLFCWGGNDRRNHLTIKHLFYFTNIFYK
jgi:hypothetical protein